MMKLQALQCLHLTCIEYDGCKKNIAVKLIVTDSKMGCITSNLMLTANGGAPSRESLCHTTCIP